MTEQKDKDRIAVARYYAQAAAGYDEREEDPERAADLDEVAGDIERLLAGQTVVELACGTGRWTGVLAQSAGRVIATDVNAEMLDLARAKGLPADKVSFVQADGLDLPAELAPAGQVGAVFIGFWWSHLTRAEQERLLGGLRARFGKNTLLVLLDDDYVEGLSEPVARTDAQGNTYQVVVAADGERVELPKNYPTDSTLRKRLADAGREIRIARWESCWLLTCRLK